MSQLVRKTLFSCANNPAAAPPKFGAARLDDHYDDDNDVGTGYGGVLASVGGDNGYYTQGQPSLLMTAAAPPASSSSFASRRPRQYHRHRHRHHHRHRRGHHRPTSSSNSASSSVLMAGATAAGSTATDSLALLEAVGGEQDDGSSCEDEGGGLLQASAASSSSSPSLARRRCSRKSGNKNNKKTNRKGSSSSILMNLDRRDGGGATATMRGGGSVGSGSAIGDASSFFAAEEGLLGGGSDRRPKKNIIKKKKTTKNNKPPPTFSKVGRSPRKGSVGNDDDDDTGTTKLLMGGVLSTLGNLSIRGDGPSDFRASEEIDGDFYNSYRGGIGSFNRDSSDSSGGGALPRTSNSTRNNNNHHHNNNNSKKRGEPLIPQQYEPPAYNLRSDVPVSLADASAPVSQHLQRRLVIPTTNAAANGGTSRKDRDVEIFRPVLERGVGVDQQAAAAATSNERCLPYRRSGGGAAESMLYTYDPMDDVKNYSSSNNNNDDDNWNGAGGDGGLFTVFARPAGEGRHRTADATAATTTDDDDFDMMPPPPPRPRSDEGNRKPPPQRQQQCSHVCLQQGEESTESASMISDNSSTLWNVAAGSGNENICKAAAASKTSLSRGSGKSGASRCGRNGPKSSSSASTTGLMSFLEVRDEEDSSAGAAHKKPSSAKKGERKKTFATNSCFYSLPLSPFKSESSRQRKITKQRRPNQQQDYGDEDSSGGSAEDDNERADRATPLHRRRMKRRSSLEVHCSPLQGLSAWKRCNMQPTPPTLNNSRGFRNRASGLFTSPRKLSFGGTLRSRSGKKNSYSSISPARASVGPFQPMDVSVQNGSSDGDGEIRNNDEIESPVLDQMNVSGFDNKVHVSGRDSSLKEEPLASTCGDGSDEQDTSTNTAEGPATSHVNNGSVPGKANECSPSPPVEAAVAVTVLQQESNRALNQPAVPAQKQVTSMDVNEDDSIGDDTIPEDLFDLDPVNARHPTNSSKSVGIKDDDNDIPEDLFDLGQEKKSHPASKLKCIGRKKAQRQQTLSASEPKEVTRLSGSEEEDLTKRVEAAPAPKPVDDGALRRSMRSRAVPDRYGAASSEAHPKSDDLSVSSCSDHLGVIPESYCSPASDEDGKSTSKETEQTTNNDKISSSSSMIGVVIRKYFGRQFGWHYGEVKEVVVLDNEPECFRIEYRDGDVEDIDRDDLMKGIRNAKTEEKNVEGLRESQRNRRELMSEESSSTCGDDVRNHESRPRRRRNEPDRFGYYADLSDDGRSPDVQSPKIAVRKTDPCVESNHPRVPKEMRGRFVARKEPFRNRQNVLDPDSVSEDGWSNLQLSQLKEAHVATDPTSVTFWNDVAARVNDKLPIECRDKWFSLVATPRPRGAAKSKHTSITKQPEFDDDVVMDEDDLFNATPMRASGLLDDQHHEKDQYLYLGSAIRYRANEMPATNQEDDLYSGYKPILANQRRVGYKSYINALKRDISRPTKKGKKKAAGLPLKERQLTETFYDGDADLNARLSPGGTLKVKDFGCGESDIWEEDMYAMDEDVDEYKQLECSEI